MAKGSKIGEAYVELRADADRMETELRDAKGTVERETAEMGQSVEKNVAGKFQDASSKLSGFVGAATGLLGVAALANRVGDALSKVVLSFTRAGDAARDFRQEARGLSSGELTNAIDELNDSVTSGGANLIDYYRRLTDWVGLSEESSRAAKIAILEQERAQRQANDALRRANELERARAQAQQESLKRLAEIEAGNRALIESQLTGLEKVNAREKEMRIEVFEAIAAEQDQRNKDALAKRLELISKIAQAERDAIAERERLEREADAERERRAAESAQKQADALASALTGAYERIASQQRVNDARLLGSLASIQRLLEQTRFQGQHGRSG